MKRELAWALEVQSQFSGCLSRTRSSKAWNGEINAGSRVFRRKRLRSCDSEVLVIDDCNGVSENVKETILKTPPLEGEVDKSAQGLVDENCVPEEEPKCILEKPICKEEPTGEFIQPPVEGGVSVETALVVFDTSMSENASQPEKPMRRFTRSALKPKAGPVEYTVLGNGDLGDSSNNGESLSVDKDNVMEVKASRGLVNNLELKMSKKISLNKIPSTLRELLETGLLEGLPVTYNIANQKGSRFRGVIKGVGILCSCNSCKGCQVFGPTQFERHACNAYRNAAHYICLENGKSLQQVVKACKDTSLDALEATIQDAVGSSPVKKRMRCENCKGSLTASCTSEEGPLCNLCMKSKTPQVKSTHARGREARSPNPVLTLMSPESDSVSMPSKSKSQWKITKKHQGLHRFVFEEGGLPDGTELAYYAHGKKLLEGYKRGSGIFCFCCRCEVSASLFEIHAGWASRKKPYQNIYTSNGVSLHELSLSLSKGRKLSERDNDDLCVICADGGNLLLCDGCPRAFHKECASLSSIPRGDWYCKYCQSMFQGEKFGAHNANALAAGRVSGVDPIEQITKRCIRIIKNPGAGTSGCALCRCSDFHKSGFGPRTVILCDQCEKEFHVGCLKDHSMADLKELPKGKWFCCTDCRRIHSTLQKLLGRGAEKIPDSLLNVIRKKHEEKDSGTSELDVRWRLLSGKMASPETRPLLSKAVAIFHDCFDPIVDSNGRDLIPCMVYGRNVRGQEFRGMYCAILTVNSIVVSTGVLRIFGRDIAELPLVATCNNSHGKGYFQTLFSCLERLLAFLKVKSFVLPAADEAESIWTEKFGFKRMPPDQLCNYRQSCSQMMTFQGTSLLHKDVPQCRVIQKGIK